MKEKKIDLVIMINIHIKIIIIHHIRINIEERINIVVVNKEEKANIQVKITLNIIMEKIMEEEIVIIIRVIHSKINY